MRANSLSACLSSAVERSTWASADATAAASRVVSMRAMTCPAATRSLKSARISSTIPLTWVPTWTVVTGSRVPVLATAEDRSPRATATNR